MLIYLSGIKQARITCSRAVTKGGVYGLILTHKADNHLH